MWPIFFTNFKKKFPILTFTPVSIRGPSISRVSNRRCVFDTNKKKRKKQLEDLQEKIIHARSTLD